MAAITIGTELRKAATKKNVKQRQVATETFMAVTTVNGHFNDSPVTTENASLYNEMFNDSELAMSIGHKLLGLLKLADGSLIKADSLALRTFQRREEAERLQVESEQAIECILATSEQQLTEKQKESLLLHANEYIDEILLELSQISKQLEILGMSLMDLVKMRTPYWQKQQWID